ncbi:S-adenosyl-L-methionine-dependent methyltransferase [Mycena rebaudengoi]|nr:S-adenosyl-L-methionine-dependent methyltransferase [Mycena rebaudengoi]
MPTDDSDCYTSLDGLDLFYELHGRKFNALNRIYMLPADEDEVRRSDLHHRMIKFIFHGHIYVGPVKETLQFGEHRNVLDLGTGDGSWAIEMADLFSWVKVTGVDVAPIQPEEVPVLCQFEIWDFNEHMPYDNGFFDLIHARSVHTGIPDYPAFLARAGRILRPGGLIILIEFDLRQLANSKPEEYYLPGSGPRGWFTLWETYRSCLTMLGIDVTVPQRLGELLNGTSLFENIIEHKGIIPVGCYPQDSRLLTVGQLQWMAYDLLLPALKPLFLFLGIDEAKVDRLIKDAQRDLYESEYRLSSHLHIVYGVRR